MNYVHRTAANVISSVGIYSNANCGHCSAQQIRHPDRYADWESPSTHPISVENGCTFFHNNFSRITATLGRSGFSLEYSPFAERTTGFTQAVNVRLGSLMANCLDRDHLYEKMNFLNSSCFQEGVFLLWQTHSRRH